MMCGHGIVAVTAILVETGQVPATGTNAVIGYDTPAGFIRTRATVESQRVTQVSFENVASFAYADAIPVESPFGAITVPIVFGGAFYALAAAPTGLSAEPGHARTLIQFGMAVKRAVERDVEVVHPLDPRLRGIYGTIITGHPAEGADGRNVTICDDLRRWRGRPLAVWDGSGRTTCLAPYPA